MRFYQVWMTLPSPNLPKDIRFPPADLAETPQSHLYQILRSLVAMCRLPHHNIEDEPPFPFVQRLPTLVLPTIPTPQRLRASTILTLLQNPPPTPPNSPTHGLMTPPGPQARRPLDRRPHTQ